MNIKVPVISGLIEGLTRLNERKARNLRLDAEDDMIREQNRRDDRLKTQRDSEPIGDVMTNATKITRPIRRAKTWLRNLRSVTHASIFETF